MASQASSSLARHRTVILATASVAAISAAYYLYSSFSTQSETTLRRSNALRRPHRRNAAHNHTATGLRYPEGGYEGVMNRLSDIELDPPTYGHTHFQDITIVFDVFHPPQIHQLASVETTEAAQESLLHHFHAQLVEKFLEAEFSARQLDDHEVGAIARWLFERGIFMSEILDVLEDRTEVDRSTILSRTGLRIAGAPPTPLATQDDDRDDHAGTEISMGLAPGLDGSQSEDAQLLTRAVYYIAEDRHRQEGVIHRGITCDQCDTRPIRGIRWRCANCADFDLCSYCEADNQHDKTHVFYKIKIPAPFFGYPRVAQPPPYPGKPHRMHPIIPGPLKKQLLKSTSVSQEEMDGFWDQFTCIANAQFPTDPSGVGWAIDRQAFDKAFIPRYSKSEPTPNLVYDRIFALYDTDANGLIGFKEFVQALDGLHSRDPDVRLQLAFNGYDLDNDGLVSRRDFLRLFRAYYNIQREATRDEVAVMTEAIATAGAHETINSSQPLSSNFSDSIPRGNRARRPPGKNIDRFGDPRDNRNGVDWEDERQIINRNEFLEAEAGFSAVSDRLNRHELIADRWRRRQFYVDEEEGFLPPTSQNSDSVVNNRIGEPDLEELDEAPAGMEVTEDTDSPEANGFNGSCGVSRGSRSSSRVRFQDDIELETRSNASTSSRPIGERWGGYEIPEAEKDLGRDLFYQVSQQGFNELLDPIFREKEDLAMEALATEDERSRWRSLILQQKELLDSEHNQHRHELLELAADVDLETFSEEYKSVLQDYAAKVNREHYQNLGPEQACGLFMSHVCSADKILLAMYRQRPSPEGSAPKEGIDRAYAARLNAASQVWVKLCQELFPAIIAENKKAFKSTKASDPTTERERTVIEAQDDDCNRSGLLSIPNGRAYLDPTMPQNRPNSLQDIIPDPTTNTADEPSLRASDVAISISTSIPESIHNVDSASVESNHFVSSRSGSPATNDNGLPNPHQAPPSTYTSPSPSPTQQSYPVFLLKDGPHGLSSTWGDYSNHMQAAAMCRKMLDLPHPMPPDLVRLNRLGTLEEIDREIANRGGPGRLTYEEFKAKVLPSDNGPGVAGMAFVESWLECVGF